MSHHYRSCMVSDNSAGALSPFERGDLVRYNDFRIHVFQSLPIDYSHWKPITLIIMTIRQSQFSDSVRRSAAYVPPFPFVLPFYFLMYYICK